MESYNGKTIALFVISMTKVKYLYDVFLHTQRVNLSFDFPFYGHFLREITVATGGKYITPLFHAFVCMWL